jgi:PAS domain S-box-containing protein
MPLPDTENTREREDDFRAVLDAAEDGIYVVGRDGACTYLNRAGASMLGYRPEELMGRPIHDLVHHTRPDGSPYPAAECRIGRAAIDGLRLRVEDEVFWHKDGSPVPVSYAVSPITRAGQPAGAVVTYRDTREATRAHQQLAGLLGEVSSERQRLEEIFQQAPSFMCVLSGPEHVFERANERYLRLVGYRDILGKPVRDALPEVVGQGFIGLLDKVYRTGEPFVGTDVRVSFGRPGDATEERFVDFVYQPFRAPDGTITGVFAQGIDITERKRAESALRAKDERIQLLVENARDYAFIFTDPQGIVLEWGGGAERITGFTAEEAIGRDSSLIFTARDIEEGKPAHEIEKARRDGRAEDKRWHVRRDGSGFFGDGVMVPVLDEDGGLRGFGKVIRDATAEWQAAEDLARVTGESERRRRLYETFLSNTPDLAYVFDLEHRFAYANDVLLRMWGRNWEDAIGKTCLELGYEPWHAEMHDREIEQVKATKKPIRGEVPFEGAFGRRIYDYIFVPVFGPDGEVEAIAGTTRDVTERKASEEERETMLQAEQRRANLLSRVAQASKAMSAVLSVQSIAGVLTESARMLIGAHQSITSLKGEGEGEEWTHARTAFSFSDKYARYRTYDAKPTGQGIYAEVCRTNTAMRLTQEQLERHPAWHGFGEERSRHPPCNGWLAVPLVGHGGKNLGLVQLSDKVEGHFTEEDEAVLAQMASMAAVGIENARLYDSLREQDRRKDEFLATLAHELRNPLAPLRTGLEIIRRAGGLTGPAARSRDMMERQLAHMVRLIDDLMDVSRVTQGKVTLKHERLSLQRLVDAAVEASGPLIQAAGHALEIELPGEPVHVRGDVTRLAQVLSNLLNNASKYTDTGGRIRVSARREGRNVEIRVEDNGVGIPAEMLQKIFDLFTQVGRNMERSQGGLGIGLSLARKLVEMHGGSLSAQSPGPGQGSTFIVKLPLDDVPSVDDGPADPEVARLHHGGRRRVLVVDDNVDAAESLAMLLELSGFETRVEHSGPGAIEQATAYRPHAVFLDIGLPVVSGYDVVRELRRHASLRDALIVAVTGWGSDEDQKRSREAGFDDHLTKPVTTERVAAVLARLQ